MNNEKTITLTLTENDAAVLQNLLDGAVKFFGRQAAQAVAVFDQKITAALSAEKKDPGV